MPWFSYELCKVFIIKTCEQCFNLNQCAQRCSFCVTTCPSLKFDSSQDWSTCFCLSGCILSCFEVSYQNLTDPAFSRVKCESLFRYIGSDCLKFDIGPSESPDADSRGAPGGCMPGASPRPACPQLLRRSVLRPQGCGDWCVCVTSGDIYDRHASLEGQEDVALTS
jgi:hypothetical protein